ncbi:MAG TPA: hypothetical protein VIR30_02405 [Nocardioides sp.]
MAGVVIASIFVVVSIFNYVKSDRVADLVRSQDKPITRLQSWIVGSPPSGDHVRKRSLLTGGFFLLVLVINLRTL